MAAGDGAGPSVVQVSGPATLYESAEVHEVLRSALAEGGDVVFDLETSGPWDLSGLQLLLAAVASGRKLGQSVRFVQVPKVCAEIAERCGLGEWLREHTDSFL
jgi:anti-anti-sigma regulatory factor